MWTEVGQVLIEGVTSNPSVSVPRVIGAKPALTTMAEPEEEPRRFWNLFQQT